LIRLRPIGGIFSHLKKNKPVGEGVTGGLPRHIAVIMDGNGRWAKKRGLPRAAGHAAGAEVFRTIAAYCKNLGVEHLTVYAFSTENWGRPDEEVSAIMSLLEKYLREAIETMARDKIKLHIFGDTSGLSAGLKALIARTDEISGGYSGFQANICLNYGARAEIVRAAELASRAGEITAETIEQNLWSAGLPDPDLIIRPGGELRLSNFLLWQGAYSELYFTDTLWPDFTPAELDRALGEYGRRCRRFGKI
jgi:undecaprenyl diphosphate synthase